MVTEDNIIKNQPCLSTSLCLKLSILINQVFLHWDKIDSQIVFSSIYESETNNNDISIKQVSICFTTTMYVCSRVFQKRQCGQSQRTKMLLFSSVQEIALNLLFKKCKRKTMPTWHQINLHFFALYIWCYTHGVITLEMIFEHFFSNY